MLWIRKESFLYTILALSLLIVPHHEARADVKGIPTDERFAAASFPFARTVDGCTAWRKPERYGDQWSVVSFADACVAHDQCFHTLGTKWADCNQRFLDGLHAACGRDLKRETLERGRVGEPDPQALRLCYEIGDVYYRRVQNADAAKRFDFAQHQQQEYLRWVASVVDELYKSVLKRSATAKEQARALTTLATTDATLADLKAALMGESMARDERMATAAGDEGSGSMPILDETAPGVAAAGTGSAALDTGSSDAVRPVAVLGSSDGEGEGGTP